MVTNTVVCWHTGYLGLAVEELLTTGSEVDDEVVQVAGRSRRARPW
ncbi:hypothetical protein [Streptomyces laculatispora]|nr:hypothetical protein [Streptomyces laculatispora]MBO0915482.1 hypothetical protein [Streptomyces laculatispora]